MGGGQLQQLQQLTASGWLFSAIDLVATGVGATDWNLFRKAGTDRTELPDTHPAAILWEAINPFFTRNEFLETAVQHRMLVGEMWWLKLRNNRGEIEELWPIRPDRMVVVPGHPEYIKGYIYRVGGEAIPLEVDDIIFRRRPHPVDPYRGIGVVDSILMTLMTEKEAAIWTRNFFSNGALPGGIIEVPDSLSDAEFEQMQQHWQSQHQGVANAHRVSIIEKGKWVDRKFSQRDMQLDLLRKLDRDIILGALHISAAMMGITESVNRANAEAGEVQFSRWTLRPLLVMLRNALNKGVAPAFGTDLEFDFIDPTPTDRTHNHLVAMEGYKAQYITRDEARALDALPPADEGGDEFFAPLAFSAEPPVTNGLHELVVKQLALPGGSTLADLRDQIQDAWTRRLSTELEALLVLLGRNERSFKALAEADVDAFDWDWWAKYGNQVVEELTAAFAIVFAEAAQAVPPSTIQLLAANYAETRGAQLLRIDGDLNIAHVTRERVRIITADVIREGQSIGELSKRLRADAIFSRSRATTIARTETTSALGQGQKQAAINQGQDEKRWITQGDVLVHEGCAINEAQGWIRVGDGFASGHDTIPFHPNCRCNVIYRTAVLAEERGMNGHRVAEFRCPDCSKLLARDTIRGAPYWCERCKAEKMV
jgi:HK97 family phage portal protein